MMQAYKNKWLPLSALALGMALSFGANADEQKSVAVTAIVEHPALDAARDGVRRPSRRPATKTARTSSGSTRAPRATPAPPRRSPASSSATSPT